MQMFDARFEALSRIVAPAAILPWKTDGGRGIRILLHPPFPIVVEIRPKLSCCFSLLGIPARRGLSERQHRQDEQHAKNAHCQYRQQTDHPGLPTFANSLSRSCASITISRAVSSMPMAVLSTSTASAARTSGDTLRSRSRLSRSITSSNTSASVNLSPFSRCSFQRRSARVSGAASRKIFSSALGKTTVPISRPSITTPPPAPARCCSATSTSRTFWNAATCDAACAAAGLRISCVTSAPSRKTQFFAPAASCSGVGDFSSMRVSFASFSRRDSSFSGMPRFKAFNASARYIAPLSRYTYCKSSATRRATLLFPEPAGPSMAIVSLGINALRDCFPMRSETHDVVAAIDVNRFAGDARACVGKQEGGSSAYLGRVDIALQGCAIGMRLEHVAQPSDGSRGKRLDGPRGNGIDANALRPQVECQIAHARFQCGFGYAHHVVSRHNFFRAVVGHRNDAAAGGHQRSGRARHRNQRIHTDVVGDAKSFARSIEELTLQFLRGRKSDAVHDTVQHAVS